MVVCRGRRREGQALVECALVLPLLVTLALGLVQITLYIHARDVLVAAAQEGARLAAEDGRRLEDGYVRTHALVRAGLGEAVQPVEPRGRVDADVVEMRIDSALRPILPLPIDGGLPINVRASVSRERFRPGGGNP
jgi:Flp pilus assembly protein TadG